MCLINLFHFGLVYIHDFETVFLSTILPFV